jgi:hypothetical protein
MASRLLARLDAAIAKTRDPVASACLRAERAGGLARLGRVDEARRTIEGLHARFTLRPQPAVSAWLALAEGLCDHFGDLAPSARDRMRRAYALSGAAHLAPLHALAAAWLAHMEYGHHESAQMAAHLAEALRLAAPDHHAARARACLVAALGYHWAGRLDRAQPWFDRARQHALADGDDATLSALMYDRATGLVAAIRMATAFGDPPAAAPGEEQREALLCVQSCAAYEAAIGGASLAYLVPLLHAQLLTAAGDAAPALDLFERWLAPATAGGMRRMKRLLLADIAWCHWLLGQADKARAGLAAALAEQDPACDIDDRAFADARLAQLAQALGDATLAATLREQAQRDVAVHRAEQARLAALLDDTLAGL